MARAYGIFSVLVVTVSVFLVLRAISTRISWPLAIHPDADQVSLEDPGAQQVGFSGEFGSDHHDHDNHRNLHKAHPNHAQVAHASSQFSRKIVAVGDLHGDMPNAQAVLQMAGVVDADGNWTGDVDFFVQTGDIIDRGDDTIKLYMWMDKLRGQAQAVGGTVLSHLGNHEWMNVIGTSRSVLRGQSPRTKYVT